jgi:RecA/RadA recombinase
MATEMDVDVEEQESGVKEKVLTVGPLSKKKIWGQMQGSLDSVKVSTGILPFDIVMGGGYNEGDLIEIASPSGRGKTTLCLEICRRMLEEGKKCAFIDVESGVKSSIMKNLDLLKYYGEELGSSLAILTPKTYDDLSLIFQIIVTGDPADRYDIVVVDSFSALSAKLKPGAKPSVEQAIGIKARQEKGFLELYKNELRGAGSTIFLINQMRVKFKGSGHTMKAFEDSTASNATQHYCDVRLWINDGPKMVQMEQTVMGSSVKTIYGCHSYILSKKNRNTRPMIPVLLPVVFGLGISNKIFLEELMREHGFYTVSGSKTTFKLKLKDGSDEVEELRGVVAATIKERRAIIGQHLAPICDFLRRNGFLTLARTGNEIVASEDQEFELSEDDDE